MPEHAPSRVALCHTLDTLKLVRLDRQWRAVVNTLIELAVEDPERVAYALAVLLMEFPDEE